MKQSYKVVNGKAMPVPTTAPRAGDHVYKSKRWQRTRAMVLAEEPMCRGCGLPAQAVDHIVDISKGGAWYDRENLRPLCNRCHNAKRAKHRFCVHGYPVGQCCHERNAPLSPFAEQRAIA